MKHFKLVTACTLAWVLPACICCCPVVSAQEPDTAKQAEAELVEQENAIQAELDQQAPFDLQATQDLPVQEPLPNIDKSLVGWYEAGSGTNGERIGTQIRASWVMINETDSIQGQVVGNTGDISIFLLRNGFVVAQSKTNDIGSFRLEGLTPGPYAIAGYSPDVFFVYGFLAIKHRPAASGFPNRLNIQAVSGAENNLLIGKIIKDNAPRVNFRAYGQYDIGEGAEDPPEYFGWQGLETFDQPVLPANSIQAQPISLLSDGRLIGRVHQIDNKTGRPVEVFDTRIIVIQGGQIVAETQTDSLGVFEISGLSGGNYGIIAVGSDGLAALGIEIVDADTTTQPDSETRGRFRDNNVRNIAFTRRQDNGGAFDILLSDPESIGWLNNYVAEQLFQQAMDQPRPQPIDPALSQLNNIPFDYFSLGGGGPGGFAGLGGFGDVSQWLVPAGMGAIILGADSSPTSGGVTLISPFFP